MEKESWLLSHFVNSPIEALFCFFISSNPNAKLFRCAYDKIVLVEGEGYE